MYSTSLSIKALLLSVLLVFSFSSKADNTLSQAELDQMLAPVALYPDTVLTHVLIAATYPLEVVQAARWSARNSGLSGDAAVQAVANEDWEPSVKALVAFPDLLKRLSDDLAWTQQLGEMFLTDEAAVLASIQQLRERAYQHGSLNKLEHVTVQREREVIVIEPRRPEVIYVPYYDTRIVYGNWWWSAYPPVYWHAPRGFHASSHFYWGPSIVVRPSFYFSIFDWHHRHIVVHHHYYHTPPRYFPRRNKHYVDARRWQHDSYHRRGVHYRHEVLNRQHNFGYARQVTKEYRAETSKRRDQPHRGQHNTNQQSREHTDLQRPVMQRRTAEQVNLRQAPVATASRQLNSQQRAERTDRTDHIVRPDRSAITNREQQANRQLADRQPARTTVSRPMETSTPGNTERQPIVRQPQSRPEQRITPVTRPEPQVQRSQPERQVRPQVQPQRQVQPQVQPQRPAQQIQRPAAQPQRAVPSVSREVRSNRESRSIQ